MRLAPLLALLASLQAVAAELPRVVSTNVCADQLALRLAAPGQLLSVSALSRDPGLSGMAAQAQQVPINHAGAEEIIALNPDLVLASRRWLAHNRAELLREHGIEVLVLPFPNSWDEIYASTRLAAKRLGREEEGEALVAETQARLARLQQRSRPLRALYLRPNGGTAGRGTYVDTVFQAVGLENHQALRGSSGWGRFDLEELVSDPPHLFVAATMPGDDGYARAAYSRHPRVQQLLASRPFLQLQGSGWGCSDWQLVSSAERLAAAVDALAVQP